MLVFLRLGPGADLLCITRLILLPCSGNRQIVLRNRTRNSGTGDNECALAHCNRSNKVHVAADKGIIANLGSELIISVIINGDGAAADIDILTDLSITDIA